ncbi:hypothetical protein [Streptomyces formicae]|uniref:Uncharacterized protein n=1 Tax=Streptomyces formicae TaxID=1616117 RepID=A0A291QAK6_9ACTN|nr:hypothetical protein KY5_3711 [Streptomyces formicae]
MGAPPGDCPQCWQHAYDKSIHRRLKPREDCPQCVDHMVNALPVPRAQEAVHLVVSTSTPAKEKSMSEKNRAVFDFGDANVTFGGPIVMGDQVGVSSGIVHGDVVMGGSANTSASADDDSE